MSEANEVNGVVMRKIDSLSAEEIDCINQILKGEYYYSSKLNTSMDVEYRCFTKSHAIYSGLGVVKVYEYLKSVGIDVFA